jgi:hypothetical protein
MTLSIPVVLENSEEKILLYAPKQTFLNYYNTIEIIPFSLTNNKIEGGNIRNYCLYLTKYIRANYHNDLKNFETISEKNKFNLDSLLNKESNLIDSTKSCKTASYNPHRIFPKIIFRKINTL